MDSNKHQLQQHYVYGTIFVIIVGYFSVLNQNYSSHPSMH